MHMHEMEILHGDMEYGGLDQQDGPCRGSIHKCSRKALFYGRWQPFMTICEH